jgi:hypothetical protein
MLAKLMSYGLSHISRLGAVLSPCIVDESSANGEDSVIHIRPNPATRFFTDNVQHELCMYLGLAEVLGFDLERDLKTTPLRGAAVAALDEEGVCAAPRGGRRQRREPPKVDRWLRQGFGRIVRPPGVRGAFRPGIEAIP